MTKYKWNNLTPTEEEIAINNLLLRAMNLRKYAPKDNEELKQGYEANADRIDNVLKKIGARTTKEKRAT